MCIVAYNLITNYGRYRESGICFFVFGKIQKSTFRLAVVVQFCKNGCYNRAIKRFGGKQ